MKWWIILSALLCAVSLVIFSSPVEAKITLATNNAPEGSGVVKALKEYRKLKNIDVEVVEAPYANLFEKELLDLQQGTGQYDVILLDDPWFPQFAGGGYLTDLEPFFQARGLAGPDEDFLSKSIALCRYPYKTGKLYALPSVGNAQMFFYRGDLFAKYGAQGAPKTWDDAYAIMKKITEEEPGVYGYVLRGQQGNPVVANFMPIFWSFGARMFDENLKPLLNSPESIEALRFFLKLKAISPPGAESFNAAELALHIQLGTAAATINWPAFVSTFEDPKQSKVVGKIQYAPIPSQKVTGSSEIGHWLVAIPKASKNKEEAFDFILWLTSAEVQKKLALDPGSPPTRQSVFLDKELNAKPEYRHYPVLMEAIEHSTPRPRIAEWNEVENTFGVILSSAVAGQIDPIEAMQKANREIEAIMKRAGHY